ncbi:MAG: MoxR family ATPase [Alphaproteobacteria bacterium]|nr:MoxR family ATPase [Alphaproteobacteria bacterium]
MDAGELLGRLSARVRTVIRGKDDVVELCLVAVAAGGHVLLEDVPGVGKTTLATALAGAMGGRFARVQFTSDLLPGDITGVSVLSTAADGTLVGDGAFRFREGPIFANVVLADEINRATPKTQSALLEAMNERRVTVDGTSHLLPQPFTVLATQNPHDFHGTFPLPDSQLDRFLVRLSMGYPDREHEREVLRAGGRFGAGLAVEPVAGPEQVAGLVDAVGRVKVHEEVEDYLLELVHRTRDDPRFVRGVSTRGAGALYAACRALSLIRGRDYVIPEDVRTLAVPVLAHRVLARAESGRSGEGARAAVQELLWELPAPD